MKSGVKYYIHCIIGILIMLVFRFISPFGPVTEVGVKVLGVFLGTMYLWTFVDTLWPSLFGVLMLGLTGFGSFNGLLSSTFGNPYRHHAVLCHHADRSLPEEGICEYTFPAGLSPRQDQYRTPMGIYRNASTGGYIFLSRIDLSREFHHIHLLADSHSLF